MKVFRYIGLLSLATVLLLTRCDQGIDLADPIRIPDQSFKNVLLAGTTDEEGKLVIIDSNGDGQISYAEAEAVTYLDVSGQGLSDLTGIEEFIHLEKLLCHDNELMILDVSDNEALTSLVCKLDISQNRDLVDLFCAKNQITGLDLELKYWLRYLYCGNNPITSLNISDNVNLWILDVTEMPGLEEVCVWELPFPPEHVWVENFGSPNIFFTDSCSP